MLALWRPVFPLLDANRSFGFCLECAQRQGCPWHRRTREGQTGFDFEWWANIIQKMTFELCHHAPETWKCDSFYNQGPRAGERLKVTAFSHSLGNSELWRDCSPLPPSPVEQPPGTSSPTGVRHQLWLLLAILIMGRNTLVEQASQLKEDTWGRTARFSNGSACSGALIWTVPLSSTLAASPAGLWWQHTPALQHRAQRQHLICPEGLLLLEEPVLGLFQTIPLVGVASTYTHL